MGAKLDERIHDAKPDFIEEPDGEPPRLGRRESEPHSAEITYLYDVLSTNMKNSRTFWDLHHYFKIGQQTLDLVFDISYFSDFSEPKLISSYKAWEYENRVPDLVINVLSVSTWRKDFMETMEYCQMLKIPYYLIFAPYHVASQEYRPPFLRLYALTEKGKYEMHTLRDIAMTEGSSEINKKNLISLKPKIPLSVGLKLLTKEHKSGSPVYRVFFFDEEADKKLLGRAEKEEKEKKQFKEERNQIEKEKDQIEKEKNQIEKEY